MIDLDRTDACEHAARCAGCGASDGLTVQTATTPVGVICLTLCPSCTDAGKLPRLGMAEAVNMSCEHCRHLGITADEMAAAMDQTDHTVRHYGADAS
jgi:hypothetical protein